MRDDRTAVAYDVAVGCCLDAAQSLRRFAGTEAIDALKHAIRLIEQEQQRGRREATLERSRMKAAMSVPVPVEPGQF